MSKPAQPNRSLIDGIEVLLAAADAGEPVGVRDLARRLGLESTRTQRLLGTLAHLGMLRQTEDRRYAAGPGLSVLGAIATSQQSMLPIMVPRMHRLTEQFQCTCALGTLWRDRVTYLAVTGADKDPRTAVGANPSYPLEQSSIGILLLSWQENTYAHEHGLTASLPAAEAARAAGLARLKQPGGRVSLALPIASTAGAPHLALACSLPEQVATEADLLIAMRQAVEQ